MGNSSSVLKVTLLKGLNVMGMLIANMVIEPIALYGSGNKELFL